MRIREDHALTGQPVAVRRSDLTVCVQAFQIAVTKIIGQDDHHVGSIGGKNRLAEQCQSYQKDQMAYHSRSWQNNCCRS